MIAAIAFLMEFLFIPVSMVVMFGWWGLGVWAFFFMVVRPVFGNVFDLRGGSLPLVVVDQMFTVGLCIVALWHGHWLIGIALAAYSVLNLYSTIKANLRRDPLDEELQAELEARRNRATPLGQYYSKKARELEEASRSRSGHW